MKVLITGNMGYIGSVLIKYLREKYHGLCINGFDAGYFGHCLTNASRIPESRVDIQYMGDIRQFPGDILDGIDVVIHLAAISNDPIGSRFEAVTQSINISASRKLVAEAKKRGVGHFIFASSCSLYGTASDTARVESDALNPISIYARSKAEMEKILDSYADNCFKTISLRFATACGMSDRLRLDLVLNDFVASAVLNGTIQVLSDGTPWRPLIHVRDMARAIDWALHRDLTSQDKSIILNVGSDQWTYQMRDLAHEVANVISNANVEINTNAQADDRSYKVDFSEFKQRAPSYQPKVTFQEAVIELCEGVSAICDNPADFRNSDMIRLKCLERHIKNKQLTNDLYWCKPAS